jgi:RNA polymerase sigma-54 factor
MDLSPESVQKMMLTPKMLLSMHVLQLNIMDLRVFIQAELLENPLLEEEYLDTPPEENEEKLNEEISRLMDERIEEEENSFAAENNFSPAGDEKKGYLDSLITGQESLYEHLRWQLEVLSKDDEQKRIADFLIGNLDDNGYLSIDIKEVQDTLEVSSRSVKNALSFVRSLNPPGVCARNLKESLLIQLIYAGKSNTGLYKIIYFYLEDLEKGNYERIAKALSLSIKEVELAKKRLSYLNPRPGANFGRGIAVRIIPDAFLEKNNGSYKTYVNEKDLPAITLSRNYLNLLRNKKTDCLTKKYISNKLLSARWLVDAIKQRKNMLERICSYLAEIQKDFLESGEIAAKPLSLKEVANEFSISEATVSRTVSNKYIQAPNGIIALKKFFVSGVKQETGIISTFYIQQKIKDLIENEDKKKPLKDKLIQELLKKEGINISRRTVAKYRNNLDIASFNRRK